RGFFNGTDAEYATLVQLADIARRSANPNARLAGPEMSVGGFDPSGYLDSVMTRLQPYLRANDVITFHWYPGQGSLTDWVNAFNAKSRGQEVWLTETGDHTCNDTEQRRWTTSSSIRSITATPRRTGRRCSCITGGTPIRTARPIW